MMCLTSAKELTRMTACSSMPTSIFHCFLNSSDRYWTSTSVITLSQELHHPSSLPMAAVTFGKAYIVFFFFLQKPGAHTEIDW